MNLPKFDKKLTFTCCFKRKDEKQCGDKAIVCMGGKKRDEGEGRSYYCIEHYEKIRVKSDLDHKLNELYLSQKNRLKSEIENYDNLSPYEKFQILIKKGAKNGYI